MNARWVRVPPSLNHNGDFWVAVDADDEVLASAQEGHNGLIYASISGHLGGVGAYQVPLTHQANMGRNFLSIQSAKRWIERQLANSYTFNPAQNTGWTGVVAGLGVSG